MVHGSNKPLPFFHPDDGRTPEQRADQVTDWLLSRCLTELAFPDVPRADADYDNLTEAKWQERRESLRPHATELNRLAEIAAHKLKRRAPTIALVVGIVKFICDAEDDDEVERKRIAVATNFILGAWTTGERDNPRLIRLAIEQAIEQKTLKSRKRYIRVNTHKQPEHPESVIAPALLEKSTEPEFFQKYMKTTYRDLQRRTGISKSATQEYWKNKRTDKGEKIIETRDGKTYVLRSYLVAHPKPLQSVSN